MRARREWGAKRRAELRRAVVERDGAICWLCGKAIVGIVSLDHVVPVSFGGNDDIENLRPSCLACNVARGNRMRAKRQLVPLNTTRKW